jgi:thermitase
MYNVLKSLVLLALITVLAACNSVGPQQSELGDFEVASVATVTLQASDTEDSVAARYGAKVISFKPEAGFAILGFPKGQLTALTTTTNQDFFASPEVQMAGNRAWGGGKGAWGGGMKAWGSGKGAWGSGTTTPVPPSENDSAWTQLNVYNALSRSQNFGAGIKVAVIDTGLDLSHSIFQGQGSLAPSSEWKDFIDGDTQPQEVGTASDAGFGHGTAVAGLILQVAPRATILPLRVLDKDGSGDLDDVVAAMDWAMQKGARILNLSLGANVNDDALYQMMKLAASRDILVVTSSGNSYLSSLTYPARMTYWNAGNEKLLGKVYGVGSVSSTDLVSSFSNYGSDIVGYAPGEALYSAYPGEQMVQATGTSFAAPLYSGALALALSENPSISATNLFIGFTNTSAPRSEQRNMWSKNLAANGIEDIGSGLLDVNGLVVAAQGLTNPVGNWNFGWGFDFWSWKTNTAIAFVSGDEVAKVTGRGGVGQVITGLRPNTTYKLSASLRVNTVGDSVVLGVKNHGNAEVKVTAQSTTMTTKELTFTTGATSTSAEIYVWKESTSGAAFADSVKVWKP